MDAITEALLVGLSMNLVWNIRMKLKHKIAVIFAFGIRAT